MIWKDIFMSLLVKIKYKEQLFILKYPLYDHDIIGLLDIREKHVTILQYIPVLSSDPVQFLYQFKNRGRIIYSRVKTHTAPVGRIAQPFHANLFPIIHYRRT